MAATRQTRTREEGFSLVELMVVCAVIGIVLASSFVSLQHGMPGHQLRAASSKMASELRLARQKAVAENNNYTITFDPSSDCYSIWDDDGSDGFRSVGEQVRVIQLAEGIHLGAIAIGASNTVTLRPNGSADKGGFVEIRNDEMLRRRVNITKATASITEENVET